MQQNMKVSKPWSPHFIAVDLMGTLTYLYFTVLYLSKTLKIKLIAAGLKIINMKHKETWRKMPNVATGISTDNYPQNNAFFSLHIL